MTIIFLVLTIAVTAMAESSWEPDEIGIYGPKNGYSTLEVRWGKKKFVLRMEGDFNTPKNKKLMKEWISDRAQEVFVEAVPSS